MSDRAENTVAYDQVLAAAIAAIGTAEGEIDCAKCKGTGESDVSLSYDPEHERPHFPACDACDGTGSLDLTTSQIAARALAAGLPLLGGLLPRREEVEDLRGDLERVRRERTELERALTDARGSLDAALTASGDWWAQAQALRAAIAAHHTSDHEALDDHELYTAARRAWQWPSFGDPDFDQAYPAITESADS